MKRLQGNKKPAGSLGWEQAGAQRVLLPKNVADAYKQSWNFEKKPVRKLFICNYLRSENIFRFSVNAIFDVTYSCKNRDVQVVEGVGVAAGLDSVLAGASAFFSVFGAPLPAFA